MKRDGVDHEEALDFDEQDTLVDLRIPRVDHASRRLAVGTGTAEAVPAPRVPEGAKARGKGCSLGVRFIRVRSLLAGLVDPKRRRR